MWYMKHSKLIYSFLCVIFINLLISCAGMSVKKTAQSEFESGLSLFNRGQYEESIPHFERATELIPDFGRAYLYIGRAYLNLGKWQKALPALRTAFRLAPEESNKEISEIIMDFFFKNASKLDQDTQSQILDILKLK
jgi:tetratricopeptide (TPR) repeat protein